MKIAFSSTGTQWEDPIDPRFGRAEYFLIYDEDKDITSFLDNTDVVNEAHGAGPRTAQRLTAEKADVLITGNGPGGNAAMVLQHAGIDVYIGAGGMSIKEAYSAYKEKMLTKF
jgi:predicted Fe-Mo cluster-binding NifX family protein